MTRALGLQLRFISAGAIENGELTGAGYRLLILPHAIALSPAAAEQLRRFVAQGGTVIADGEPGRFDEHGRKLAAPLLSDLFAGTVPGSRRALRFDATAAGQAELRRFDAIVAASGVHLPFVLRRPDGRRADGIGSYLFRDGAITLLALQRDAEFRIGRTGDKDGSRTVVLALPHALYAYAPQTGERLGKADRFTLRLDAVEPLLLALSPDPLPEPRLVVPGQLRAGEVGVIELGSAGGPAAAKHVWHVVVTDPKGRLVGPYSGNVVAEAAEARKLLPFALNDEPGRWRVRATDLLSGRSATAEIDLRER